MTEWNKTWSFMYNKVYIIIKDTVMFRIYIGPVNTSLGGQLFRDPRINAVS